MRVKLNQKDIDLVFNTLDTDGDNYISYKEFCEFSEEKRRGIDPFDSLATQQQIAKNRGLTDSSLKVLSKNPYLDIQGTKSPGQTSMSSTHGKYEDLESKATLMNIINNGRVNKQRQGGIPVSIKNDLTHTFGIGSHSEAKIYSMSNIISHSDNLNESLAQKINSKMNEQRLKGTKSLKTVHTKASELRSKSVLSNKALHDIDHKLDLIKMNKGHVNEASFSEIEREKLRLARMFLLPPLARISQMDNTMTYNTENVQSQKNDPQ